MQDLTPQPQIVNDDPRAEDVRALLDRHLAFARAVTPPESVYALDSDGLSDPAVTFWSYRADGRVLGVAALKHLDDQHGEVKSMHTATEARGRGIARALLDHVIAVARERGYRRLSLETGAGQEFAPAHALYTRAGFRPCGPFGDYRGDPSSRYFTLPLAETGGG